jgi:hypothetical protein
VVCQQWRNAERGCLGKVGAVEERRGGEKILNQSIV